MEGGLQELDETQYWLEVLVKSGIGGADAARELWRESEELIRMFVRSVRTAKGRRAR